ATPAVLRHDAGGGVGARNGRARARAVRAPRAARLRKRRPRVRPLRMGGLRQPRGTGRLRGEGRPGGARGATKGGVMSDRDADEREIRAIQRQWWESNVGLDSDRMRECFAPEYLMWNLNGHPYFSLQEKIHLFDYYKQHLVPTEPPELWDIRVTVEGDMAYVTSQGVLPFAVTSDEGSGSAVLDAAAGHCGRGDGLVRARSREACVSRGDAGPGSRQWKIWHFHCSPLAPLDEPRPGFGDTGRSREVGVKREQMAPG